MPIKTSFNKGMNIIEHICSGPLEYSDIIDAFDTALESEEFHPGMHVLWDFRSAIINATPEQMQALVTHVGLRRQQRGTDYKLAVVAGDTVLRMLADIFKALSSPLSFEVAIFSDIDEARSWLVS